MRAHATGLEGLLVLEPTVHGDERGFFLESFNQRSFEAATNSRIDFVQDNHSRSARNVLRGLHYQLPHAQGKLIRVVAGRIWDVAVDVRRSSPTFLQWFGIDLSAGNFKQLWVPPGFAHGFVTMSETADVLYKATDFYHPETERSVVWNDPDVGIEWPVPDDVVVLSDRDRAAPRLDLRHVFD